jgi:hypothetical protein
VEARRPPAAGLFACRGLVEAQCLDEPGGGVERAEEFGELGGVPVLGEPVVFGEAGEAFGGADVVAAGLGDRLGERSTLGLGCGGRRGDGGFEAGAVGLDPVVACEEISVGQLLALLVRLAYGGRGGLAVGAFDGLAPDLGPVRLGDAG